MYENFFGFKENPFRLVPNPTYLFLSKSHEEALAHLKYAISQGNGFAKITGEVGTGKTTLCRAFLENLDGDTDAAYIFNPKLNSIQLLKAINDEFGVPSSGNTTKELIDTLNAFLMTQKSQGRKVVLLIDEAQNLTPAVLEQIRLLSNLETTQSKLLQIILVGQPELDVMLNSPGLRQLEQRISLSYRLSPLTLKETIEYIRHRITIASWKPGETFGQRAVRAVFAYSRGIPRRINIACDRTLLIAYGMNQHRIRKKHARLAIQEIRSKSTVQQKRLLGGRRGAFVFSILFAMLAWILIRPPNLIQTVLERPPLSVKTDKPVPVTNRPIPPPVEEPAPAEASSAPVLTPMPAVPAPAETPSAPAPTPASAEPVSAGMPESTERKMPVQPAARIRNLDDVLGRLHPQTSRYTAFRALLGLWNIDAEISSDVIALQDDPRFFRLAAKQVGLMHLRITDGLTLVKQLNLPAILEMRAAESSTPVYLTVTGMENEHVTLARDESKDEIIVFPEDLNAHWSGAAYIPWKNFLMLYGKIPNSATKDAILTLKTLIKDIGFTDIEFSPEYDEATQEAVKRIQQKHGLAVDGIVGPLTKIVLYNEIEKFSKPQLRGGKKPS